MVCKTILVTCPDSEKATDIAKQIISQKLAACVNIIPAIKSIYFWDGRMNEDNEALLIIKTNESRVKELETTIKTLHPYEVPEFIVLDSSYTNQNYMNWINDNLRG